MPILIPSLSPTDSAHRGGRDRRRGHRRARQSLSLRQQKEEVAGGPPGSQYQVQAETRR